jgi:hypothetical protein
MKRRTSIPLCALLGVMVAGLAQGATLRYYGSGDYNDLLPVTGTTGWTDGAGGPASLPGSGDTIRVNWGNNTVTLTNVAPNVARFQLGVDESGTLVVESGGSLTAIGGSVNTVGNNRTGVTGRLTVMTNGTVNSAAVVNVGTGSTVGPTTGILTLDGGSVNFSNHLWVGNYSGAVGIIILTNGGTLNMPAPAGNGMLGLGTGNATGPSGGQGLLYVMDGGVFNGYNISSSAGQPSIQPGSVLDISGSGMVTFPGNKSNTISAYTNAAKITAYGGTGTVLIDYDISNPGKTTLKAIGGYVPPTNVVWNPAANPTGTGKWSEGANWTGGGGYPPASVTKVNFNVPDAIPCTVASAALASYIVMGDNGPGGTLIVTNGAILTVGSGDVSVIGNNSNALMVVENGATVTVGTNLSFGLNPDADGTLIMNGGTVSVAGLFSLGYGGGKGTAQIKGGTLNLSQWDYFYSIQGASVLDVTGTGKVVINGDYRDSVNYYVSLGQITNSVGTNVVVDYNIINVGKTTIYPLGLDLPPAQAVWNPAANPSSSGMWDECANWSSLLCPGDVTVVTFNVPDAIPCTVTNAAVAGYVAMGNSGGPGGTLIITNGGSLTTFANNWCAVGYSSNALMIVENGCSASFASHLWVGLDPGSDGTFIMNGGTVSVGQMFGLGWQGGKGTAQINGGTLNLAQLHPTDSIKGTGVLNLTGTGTVVIAGNQLTAVANYIRDGKITANGGPNVAYGFDPVANKTTLQVAPPQQSVTSVTVSGGNTTVTYQTTAGHIYHIESSPSLSPTAWTRVAGSTTTATGASVTFTFPVSGGALFYRTVSP